MRNIKQLLICFILTMIVGFTYGQKDIKEITLYKTIEDFKSNNGEKIGKFNNFSMGIGHVALIVENGKKSVSVKDYWGFTIDSTLFRVNKSDFVMVFSVGKIVYYEHGVLHLRMLLSDTGTGWTESDSKLFFYSSTLSSAIFNNLNKFIKSVSNPDKAILKLEDGIKEASKTRDFNKRLNAVRKCVLKFN